MDRAAREAALRSALEIVETERRLRATAPWGPSVVTLKAFQQGRFQLTYADLLEQPRWRPACLFFLEELYGPRDYADRDRAFARVVPALVRIFPAEVIGTVETLLRLHAVSETLDSQMAAAAASGSSGNSAFRWTAPAYLAAWRQVGRAVDRRWQVDAVSELGSSLDRLVRQRGLRQALRMMRAPARLAGLQSMQQFLELGFDTFHAMGGSSEFMSTIRSRETQWVDWLFDSDDVGQLAQDSATRPAWLGHFPEARNG